MTCRNASTCEVTYQMSQSGHYVPSWRSQGEGRLMKAPKRSIRPSSPERQQNITPHTRHNRVHTWPNKRRMCITFPLSEGSRSISHPTESTGVRQKCKRCRDCGNHMKHVLSRSEEIRAVTVTLKLKKKWYTIHILTPSMC